jgi:methylmalonyl-CoA mutase cobalamin-binding subunit
MEGLEQHLTALVKQWRITGLPGRDTLMKTGEALLAWKRENNLPGLWCSPSLFMTATLDDAWGFGLDIIELYAKITGLRVFRIGLLKSPGEIIAACREKNPDFLGMTVLQLDSADDLSEIGSNIPSHTKIIAGGPVFRADPEIARLAKIHFVAPDVEAFLEFLMSCR